MMPDDISEFDARAIPLRRPEYANVGRAPRVYTPPPPVRTAGLRGTVTRSSSAGGTVAALDGRVYTFGPGPGRLRIGDAITFDAADAHLAGRAIDVALNIRRAGE